MQTRLAIARAVIVPYLASRFIVLATLVTTRHMFTTLRIAQPVETRGGLLSWDAAWYRDIARGGYDAVAREGLRFFPLFPLLGRAVSWVPGIGASNAVLIVANLSALALGYVLYLLVMHERDDPALARRAVWLVYLVPPSFVLVMGYAEATFMTAAAIVLLTLRTRRWWIAAAVAFAVGLVRPVGALLAVPAAVEGWQARDARSVAPAVAPVAGCLAYLVWAQRRTHDFLYPLRVQQDPARRGRWIDPIRAVAHSVNQLFTGDHVSAGVHAASAVVFAVLLVVLARRWPLSFTLYAGVALAVALSSRNLDSLERYGLATIPNVLAGADLLTTEARERVVFTLAAAGLVGAALLAFTGVLVP
ncbi:MAG TPA: hypothetical protein VN636_14610 [Acidimicrobiia bacterium]|nr:hypothetical protein [Acidimicrobiia bacterium]